MPFNQRLQQIFIERPSGARVLFFLLLTFIVWLIFGQYLIPAFQLATADIYPIDMSFPTTPSVMYDQLQAYTDESFRIYRLFFLADFFYPPFAALLWASLWGWLLTFALPEKTQAMVRRWLWLPFAVCLLDWMENLGFITVIESYPRTLPVIAWTASIVKHTKILLWIGQVIVTVTLLCQLAARRLRRNA